jgi:hypothetical protein
MMRAARPLQRGVSGSVDTIGTFEIARDGYWQPNRYEVVRWIQVVFSRLVHDAHVPLAAGHTIRQDLVHLARF